MKHIGVIALAFFLAAVPAATMAAEPSLQFLRVLQQRGYGDMAVEYLLILSRRPDMPSEIREVWDLEMSKSKKAAAAEAFDAKEEKQLLDESQKHLAKFIKEKPNHPAAAVATASWGEFLSKQALQAIQTGRAVESTDRSLFEKSMDEARGLLVEARQKFQEAEQKFKAILAALPDPSKLPTRKGERAAALEARSEAEFNVQEAQLQLGLVDYYTAQTYPGAQNAQRVATLKKAAKAFDDVFQRNRLGGGGLTVTGLYAHLWHGKVAEELGDHRLALDIYDEVLANAPEPGERGAATGLEPLFTQVEYFRLLILAKQKPQQFLPEATAWLQHFKRLRQTNGYQGVALEVAKVTLAQAQNATGAEKAKGISEAIQILTDMVRVRSQYQQEAIALRRNTMKAAGKSDLDANTFEEAAALGDAAVASAQWEPAVEAYTRALALAEKSNIRDGALKNTVREARAGAQYMIARDLFNKRKLNECIEMVNKEIVFADAERTLVQKDSAAAAQASALAVNAALNLYMEAADDAKPAALEKLLKAAEFTETNWPDRPEADDARMARAHVMYVGGRIREAIEVFDRVNPKSERYPLAMYSAGQCYWHLAEIEKAKPEAARHQDQIASDQEKAVQRLESGLAMLRKQAQPGRPLPKYLVDTQLLLAEILFKTGQPQKAAAFYQPLVDIIKAEKPQSLDGTTVRIFLGAVRAYSALNDLEKAGEVSTVLIGLGADSPQVNAVLVEFARLLDLERKKAAAIVTELESTTKAAETDAAKVRLASIQDLLGNILLKLAERQEVSLAGMVFIGDTLNTIGKTAEASQEYQKILQRAESDPEFAKTAAKAMTRVRAQLLGVLRQEGRFEEALKQADQLIQENPRALEPLMEKGRILEGWAEKDPSRFSEAVAHWVMLRGKLQSLRKKPAEYYDVMYNVAACLVREAEASKDKAVVADRAKKAEQVLKSALILSPKLNGPDTVARYKVLMNKAIAMQGRPAEPEGEKKP